MLNTAIVTTTINIPYFLDDFSKNAIKYNHENIKFYIIGDLKTPKEIKNYLNKLSLNYKFEYQYFDIDEQEHRLKDQKKLLEVIPYNSGSRKMLGNYIAYNDGADLLIQIDDDNFILDEDFISHHQRVCKPIDINLYDSNTGWYNVYLNLNEKNNIPFFPRGFPWSKRDYHNENIIKQTSEKKIVSVINGFVFEDPDIDAIARLNWPINVISSKKDINETFGLYPGTWSSFNNQNTSTNRETSRVYFTPSCAGRNSDIWTSYIMFKLTEQKNEIIGFGAPYVKQIRNEHNLWTDLKDEFQNNKLTEYFVSLLKKVDIDTSTYPVMLESLIKNSLKQIDIDKKKFSEEDFNYLKNYFIEYDIWNNSFELK